MNELALFAGAGGGILGGKLLGWRTVCAVERDAYAAQVLAQRQNDGVLKPFPIWSDVTTFDGTRWRGIVDVISGGFPCQDISAAGKGAGIEGERSGMWKEMARIIGEVRPKYAFIENSPMLTTRGLDTILADLAAIGFDAEGDGLFCEEVGGVHLRERAWIVATNPNSKHGEWEGESQQPTSFSGKAWDKFQRRGNALDDPNDWSKRIKRGVAQQVLRFRPFPWGENVRGIEDLRNRSDLPEPLFRGSGDDVAHWMDRLKAIGNGQVPRVAATAFELLRNRFE